MKIIRALLDLQMAVAEEGGDGNGIEVRLSRADFSVLARESYVRILTPATDVYGAVAQSESTAWAKAEQDLRVILEAGRATINGPCGDIHVTRTVE